MITIILSAVIAIIIGYYYFKLKEKHKFFEKRGIPCPQPEFFFGNLKDVFFKRRHISACIDEIYKAYKDKEPLVGFYNVTTPYLLIIDPELVKQITIKDFKHFRNNEFSTLSDKEKDPVMCLNPFVMRDEEWKEKRTEVATGMTQNKLRSMFPLVDDVAKKFVAYINQELKENPNRSFESREICIRYTSDTVASCIFAIDGGSFKKQESHIIAMGLKMIRSISDAAKSFFPKRLMPQDVQDFFVYLMEEAIKLRIASNNNRDDFLAHIIALKEKKDMSDIEMVAHGVTFFLDGFDTSSIGLAPVFYELAKNQAAQKRLRDDLHASFPEKSDLTYDKLLEHKFLDQVIYESLRINPPITFANRECSENVWLETSKGKVFIEKGQRVFVPLISIQQDPEYYHDPQDFLPERFDDHGGIKACIDRGVLAPFGNGPRECLGKRFAQLQLKAAVYEIVRNFEISLDTNLTAPVLEIDPDELLMNVKKGGMWLKFKKVEASKF